MLQNRVSVRMLTIQHARAENEEFCESESWEEGCVRVALRAASVRRPWMGAEVKETVRPGKFEGYSGVV